MKITCALGLDIATALTPSTSVQASLAHLPGSREPGASATVISDEVSPGGLGRMPNSSMLIDFKILLKTHYRLKSASDNRESLPAQFAALFF